MTSRERVLASIEHKTPDQVPVDLGATPSSGISVKAYQNFTSYMGYDSSPKVYDVVQQLVLPEAPVIDFAGVDVLDIAQAYVNTEDSTDSDWTPVPGNETAFYPSWFKPVRNSSGGWDAFHEDGTKIASMPAGASFYDQTCFPWESGYPDSRTAMSDALDEAMDKVLWQKLVHSPWDRASATDFWDELRHKSIKLQQASGKALMIVCGCNLFEWGTFLRRMDNFLMDIYLEKDNVMLLMELLMEKHMATLERVCASVGDTIDILRFGDDLGMDTGPFMRIDAYRELFHDHRKRLCSYVHENSSMHTFLHSCGSIYQYLPDLIDSGIEIINPVQTNCRDMDPVQLKSEFGDDIVFWGAGADTREILNSGTPQQVRTDVLNRMEIFSKNGGFVFNTIHNILGDVPPQNIEAMFNAVKEFNLK